MNLSFGKAEIGQAVKDFVVKTMKLDPAKVGEVKVSRGKGDGDDAVKAECSVEVTEPTPPGNGQE